ncbi:hypothetical protein GALMADRAFT_241385 [Galerina marginata CBS 339.88]|uniref:Uncharacterized protein n=1 Tax=Galerina marginata (strain CBS 339.88) TaxID=685588 RepID=A0A067TLW1_GALM3|nr:hypothetical protein GALMADRAFT_241385 [Galerina marginata CBS 339.88]
MAFTLARLVTAGFLGEEAVVLPMDLASRASAGLRRHPTQRNGGLGRTTPRVRTMTSSLLVIQSSTFIGYSLLLLVLPASSFELHPSPFSRC